MCASIFASMWILTALSCLNLDLTECFLGRALRAADSLKNACMFPQQMHAVLSMQPCPTQTQNTLLELKASIFCPLMRACTETGILRVVSVCRQKVLCVSDEANRRRASESGVQGSGVQDKGEGVPLPQAQGRRERVSSSGEKTTCL